MYFNSLILKIFCIVVTLSLTLADANNFVYKFRKFNLDLFHNVENQNSQKNVIISPLSVQTVIGMLHIGAEGDTGAEMGKTFAEENKDNVAMYYKYLISGFNNTSGVTIANKLYIDKNLKVKKEYRNELTDTFLSSIEAVDFLSPEETADSINEWVNTKTNKLIPQLVQPDTFTEDTNLFLVNAITFSGEWKYKFNEAYTTTENFYLDGREPIKVPMMFQTGKFLTQKHWNLKATSLILPYAKGGLSFVIFLPNSHNDFYRLEKNIKYIKLSNIKTSAEFEEELEVHLPKFKVEFECDLKNTLQNMGLRISFSASADYGGILESNDASLSVSKFIHKAVINVDEKGSTAAAASGVDLSNRFGAESFNVNRPFIYFIKDDYDFVLFSGSYKGPEKKIQ